MTTTAPVANSPSSARRSAGRRRPRRKRHLAAYTFLTIAAVAWITPILWAFYTSLRPVEETNKYGYLSLPRHLTFANFENAWTQAELPHYFFNSLVITVPAVVITLFLASCVAFILSRVNFKFNISFLILFTTGNLLPQQVLITPLYRLYLSVHL